MRLYLMRHADAMRQGAYSDADRPLTPDGEAQALLAGRALRRLDIKPQLLLSSPAMRCRATALLMADELGLDESRLRVAEPLSIGGSTTQLLQSLASLGELLELLLVGHQPGLEDLASVLLAGSSDVALHLKRGGCACLEVEAMPPRHPAVLHWLLTPRQLRSIGNHSNPALDD